MVMKICDKCKFPIKEKIEDYYQIDSFHKGKKVYTGYMHKSCSDILDKTKSEQTEKLLKMLGPMAGRVNAMMDVAGIPKPKQLVVIE